MSHEVHLRRGMLIRIWCKTLVRNLSAIKLKRKIGEDEDGERWTAEVFGGEYDGTLCIHWINSGSLLFSANRKWESVVVAGKNPF